MAIRKLIVLVPVVVFALACSKQGEGERCNLTLNISQDCGDNLTCQLPNDSAHACNEIDPEGDLPNCLPHRCCPPLGQTTSDSRCIGYSVAAPSTGTGGSSAIVNGTGGNSSAGGSTSTGGTSTAGGTVSSGGSTDVGGSSSDNGGTSASGT